MFISRREYERLIQIYQNYEIMKETMNKYKCELEKLTEQVLSFRTTVNVGRFNAKHSLEEYDRKDNSTWDSETHNKFVVLWGTFDLLYKGISHILNIPDNKKDEEICGGESLVMRPDEVTTPSTSDEYPKTIRISCHYEEMTNFYQERVKDYSSKIIITYDKTNESIVISNIANRQEENVVLRRWFDNEKAYYEKLGLD